MNKSENKKKISGIVSFLAMLIAILIGFIFGFIILLISEPTQAFNGIKAILTGSFGTGIDGIVRLIYLAIPIIMTGLSVGFAFKTGLFNIGAPGQFILGAYTAIHIGIRWTFLPESIHWLVALIGAGVVGAIWGIIPGILKAICNVNEVISSIMLNYIAMSMTNLLIKNYVFDYSKNQTMSVPESAIIPEIMVGGTNISIGIIITVIIVIIVYILLEKTTIGYELKACGKNPNASKYAGINEKKNIVISMMIAGLLAGIGGGLMYLYGAGKHIQVIDVIAEEGFMGISVALFGQLHPIGILIAGLFIAHITIGGANLQIFGYVSESVDIIIASIIYLGAFSLLFKDKIAILIDKIINKKKGDKL